jgi:hypothetical protein
VRRDTVDPTALPPRPAHCNVAVRIACCLAAALNAPARVVPAFEVRASQAHERLVASDPLVYGPACSPLDGLYS